MSSILFMILNFQLLWVFKCFLRLRNPRQGAGTRFLKNGNGCRPVRNPFFTFRNRFLIVGKPFFILRNGFLVAWIPFFIFRNGFLGVGNPFLFLRGCFRAAFAYDLLFVFFQTIRLINESNQFRL